MSISENSARSVGKFLIICGEVLFILLVTYFAYAQIFHEFFHFAVCIVSGSGGEIVFGFPSRVECPGIINNNLLVFWLYCMAPYSFLSLPVVLIFSVFKFRTSNYYVNLILISIPASSLLDTLINSSLFFIRGNDFNNLLMVGPFPFLLGWLLAGIIFLISIPLMENYWPLFKGTI